MTSVWTALHHWGWWRGSATMCVGFGLRLLGRRMCWIDLKFDLYTVVGSWPTLLHHATTKKSEDLFGSSFTGISHNCGFMSPKGKVETWKNSWIQVGPCSGFVKNPWKIFGQFLFGNPGASVITCFFWGGRSYSLLWCGCITGITGSLHHTDSRSTWQPSKAGCPRYFRKQVDR